jgi:hypothetical protein
MTDSSIAALTSNEVVPFNVTIMVDIETLAKSPNAVVTQLAFIAAPSEDLNDIISYDSFYLPLQPQINMGRRIDADTIIWWLTQAGESARAKFIQNQGGDYDVLVAFVRSFIRKVDMVIQQALLSNGTIEIIAKGPQFDVVIIEDLIQMVGEIEPWKYSWVSDLRTLMKKAGVTPNDVKHDDIVPHVALEDCRLQLRLLDESEFRLGLRTRDA